MRWNATRTESELVEGCKKGNPSDQRALYQQYHRLLFGICLRYADTRDDAQDLLQDAFIRIYNYVESFRGEGSFEGWIKRITVRICIEYCRRKSRFLQVDLNEAREVQIDTGIWSEMNREEILHLIRQMPAGYRMVFNLYAVEGYNHQEIGEMLGISEGTSKSQLSRARNFLQQRLGHHGKSGSVNA